MCCVYVCTHALVRKDHPALSSVTMSKTNYLPILLNSSFHQRLNAAEKMTGPNAHQMRSRSLTHSIVINDYMTSLKASHGMLSLGQYGHLKRNCGLLSLAMESRAITCPQGIIIGGLSSVLCSFDTGQTKIEWKWYAGGRGISTLII